MKAIILIVLVGITTISFSQEKVQYRILLDSAELVPKSYIDAYFFNFEGSMSNQVNWHKAAEGLRAGLQGEFVLPGGLGVEGMVFATYSGDEKEVSKLPMHLEAGAFKKIKSKKKGQSIKVPIRQFKTKVDVVSEESGRWLGEVDAVQTNYIEVTAQKLFESNLRGGVTFRNSSYTPSIEGNKELGTQTNLGVYGGMSFLRKAHILTQLKDKSTVSAEYMKIYVDAIFYPVVAYSTTATTKKSPIGFRTGVNGKLPGMKGWFAKMVYNVEFGLLPLDGWYWGVGIGVNVFKK